jgi:hypothetical protein
MNGVGVYDDLRRNLSKMAQKQIVVQTEWVVCKSVNWDEKTLAATDANGVEISDILCGLEMLQIKPKENAKCLIGMIDNNNAQAFLINCEEVEEVVWNGGNNKGLVKLPELIDKLNAIENKVNDIITWTATHTHAGVTPGGGTSGVAVGVTGTLTTTQEGDLENEKIKH